MENKKLVKILQKDMTELEELISDVKNQGSFNPLEMDFIHTRAKGLMQLVQLLKVDDENGSNNVPLNAGTFEEIKETVEELREEVAPEQEIVDEPVAEKVPEPPEIEAQETEDKIESEVESNLADDEKKVIEEKSETEVEDDEMLEEEADKSEANSRLGDSFLKGKSLNDLVTGENKLEFKLSNRPVENIKSSIGINDRFQYIRELFDGSSEKFAVAVTELDSKKDLKEAVDYLRNNFKWKKSETSIKFVNLVKRRFHHE